MTTKLFVPIEDVSIAAPFAAVPVHVARPDPLSTHTERRECRLVELIDPAVRPASSARSRGPCDRSCCRRSDRPSRNCRRRHRRPAVGSSHSHPRRRCATDVVSENDASAGLPSPLPPSLAVHASRTLARVPLPSGASHAITGAVTSSGGLLPLMPASTQAWNASRQLREEVVSGQRLHRVDASSGRSPIGSSRMPCVVGHDHGDRARRAA